jgi:hypothetical protein
MHHLIIEKERSKQYSLKIEDEKSAMKHTGSFVHAKENKRKHGMTAN